MEEEYKDSDKEVQSAGSKPVPQTQTKERTWGEATEDVASNMLDSIAGGGNVIQVVASGVQAAANTHGYQAKKAKQISEAQKAELEVSMMKNRDALLRMARLYTEEDRPYQQQILQNDAENSNIELENAKLGLAQNKQASANNLLKMKHQQEEMFRAGWQKDEEVFKNGIKNAIGYDGLNIFAQGIVDNSFGIDALADANTIVRAFIRSPEEGKAALREQGGWEYDEKNNRIVSTDGKFAFGTDEKSLSDLMKKVNELAKQDIAAAMTLGQDAQTMEQFALKNVLLKGDVGKVFGSYGSAYGAYQKFVNAKNIQTDGKRVIGSTDKYSKAEKLGHVLTVGLKAAVIDNQISQVEQQTLAPLMAAYVKKFGAEVQFGKTADDTFIKRQDGSKVPLKDFVKGLEERDVIGADWKNYVAQVNQTVKKNEQKESIVDMIASLGRRYGDAVYKLNDEQLSELKKVSDMTDAYALTFNIAEKGNNGNIVVPKNVALSSLQKLAELEKTKLDGFGLKGFWEAEYERRKVLDDDIKEGKRKAKNTEKFKNRKNDQFQERRQTIDFYNAMGPGTPQI
jgi:hypothetical protein